MPCECKWACANAHEDEMFCRVQDHHPQIGTVCFLGSVMQARKPTTCEPLGNNATSDFGKTREVRIIILLKENTFRNQVLLLLNAALVHYMDCLWFEMLVMYLPCNSDLITSRNSKCYH